jgi:hypothetical protein
LKLTARCASLRLTARPRLSGRSVGDGSALGCRVSVTPWTWKKWATADLMPGSAVAARTVTTRSAATARPTRRVRQGGVNARPAEGASSRDRTEAARLGVAG